MQQMQVDSRFITKDLEKAIAWSEEYKTVKLDGEKRDKSMVANWEMLLSQLKMTLLLQMTVLIKGINLQ